MSTGSTEPDGSQTVPLCRYSHEIAYRTPYLARFAEEAADGFAEADERRRATCR